MDSTSVRPAARGLIALGIVAAVLLPSTPASGGGWWSGISVDKQTVAPGDPVTAATEFLFRSLEAAEEARRSGVYEAYLLEAFDFGILEEAMGRPGPGDWWKLGGARAIRVGTVRLSGWDGNLARARASFVVPDVQAGSYALMFCDPGCSHPLGDIVPIRMTVAADPLQAQLVRRLYRLEVALERQGRRLRSHLQDPGAEVTGGMADGLEDLGARVREVERALDRPAVPEPRKTPWATFIAWFVAGVTSSLLGATVLKLRRRRRPPDAPADIDDELRALTDRVAALRR